MHESGLQGKDGNEIGGERVDSQEGEGRELRGGLDGGVRLEHITKFSITNWERGNLTY